VKRFPPVFVYLKITIHLGSRACSHDEADPLVPLPRVIVTTTGMVISCYESCLVMSTVGEDGMPIFSDSQWQVFYGGWGT